VKRYTEYNLYIQDLAAAMKSPEEEALTLDAFVKTRTQVARTCGQAWRAWWLEIDLTHFADIVRRHYQWKTQGGLCGVRRRPFGLQD